MSCHLVGSGKNFGNPMSIYSFDFHAVSLLMWRFISSLEPFHEGHDMIQLELILSQTKTFGCPSTQGRLEYIFQCHQHCKSGGIFTPKLRKHHAACRIQQSYQKKKRCQVASSLTRKGEYNTSVEQYEQLCVSKRICGKC